MVRVDGREWRASTLKTYRDITRSLPGRVKYFVPIVQSEVAKTWNELMDHATMNKSTTIHLL